jgi:Type II CAAX prenyl endopeptidase Rce1-like
VKPAAPESHLADKAGAWVDLALTLPVFIGYHVGVVFLKIKNASDIVTGPLLALASGSRASYIGMTLSIGALFAGIFALLGRGHAFRMGKFVQIIVEGAIYAVVMRLGASFIVGKLTMGTAAASDPITGLVMSLGAGFYEEIAFRAVLFGLGAKVLVFLFTKQRMNLVAKGPRLTFGAFVVMAVWALVAAAVFSGVHYVGALGDSFAVGSFVFRWVLGLALTLIFVTRGFAAAVWTHALYDAWVLVL